MKNHSALTAAFEMEGIDPALAVLVPCEKPDLADFQCNGAFLAARDMKTNPRALAQAVVDRMGDDRFSVAGPGYINVKLTLDDLITALFVDENVSAAPKKIYLDFGGPNVAKSMHVGHMRSLFIGDALQRILRAAGHTVVSDIHLGDWGLQMGLLTAALMKTTPESEITLKMLEEAYPAASLRAKEDPEFKKAAQQATRTIQNPMWATEERSFWEAMVRVSVDDIKRQLKRLGIEFTLFHGESTVARLVPGIVKQFVDTLMAVESDGAIVVPSLNEDEPPMILRNSEGGYLYAASDLVTIFERAKDEADEIIYVVDQRQALHFKQLFAFAENIFSAKLVHAGFGTVNGPDGKPLKTRDGGVPKLDDLVHQTYLAAHAKNPESITRSEQVGLACLKFGDLMNPRESSYNFDPDKFTAHEGKTGAYLLYQCVRIKSILRDQPEDDLSFAEVANVGEEERTLVFKMAYGFTQAMERAVTRLSPKEIADYTYDLAQTFSKYYAHNQIAGNRARLALAKGVHDRLVYCLDLLGIQVPDKM
jgi:arginyl-tRNA synthetase